MKELKIGDFVKASKAYARKCSNRFDKAGAWNSNEPWLLSPLKENFSGFVVGKRHVIMSEFSFRYGGNEEQSSVRGRREWVWLATESITNEPLIIRDCDIL